MKPLQVPSQDSSRNGETLSTFLWNKGFRKLYNKLLETVRKYRFLEANNWFLMKCLEEELIPKSFLVKNKVHNNSKDVTLAREDEKQYKAHNNFEDRWTTTTKQDLSLKCSAWKSFVLVSL